MPSSLALHDRQSVRDSLRKAIASSSGFQSWQLAKGLTTPSEVEALDTQIRTYLQETLETLAY